MITRPDSSTPRGRPRSGSGKIAAPPGHGGVPLRTVVTVPTTTDPRIADDETLDRARRGDSDALADLWTIYQPQVLRLLHSRGRATAEDVASQAWMDVGRNIERFEGDGRSFRNWIFTIAQRRAIDESRRVARRNESALEPLAPMLTGRSTADAIGDSLDGVFALLQTLQPVAAEVVMLRVVEDLPVAEVAAITGQSESNVRVLAHRALERLRRTIEEGGGPAFSPDLRIA